MTVFDKLIKQLNAHYGKKKTSGIVVVAEGDDGGRAHEIAEKVKKSCGYTDIRVTILGHVQRGGRPTCLERVNASKMGMEAVRALRMGMKGVMIGIVSSKIAYTPFDQAIKHHQHMDPTLLEMVEILA